MGRILLNILIVICVAVFAICSYKLVDYFYANMEADNAFDEQRNMVSNVSDYEKRLPEYENMKVQNGDFVGWLVVDGTHVNNPVVQTAAEPEYYLYRDFNGNDSRSGTVFLSNVADLYEPSDIVTVFGHNMKDGTMFGSLRRFEDAEFLTEHRRIWIDSMKNRREFEITHVMRIRVGVEGREDAFPYHQYSNFKNKAEFNKFMEQCNMHSIYDTGGTVKYGDKFILLSTCEYTYGDGSGRLVVMGKEVEQQQQTDMGQAQITEPVIGKYVIIGIGAAAVMIVLTFIVSLIRGSRRRRARRAQEQADIM